MEIERKLTVAANVAIVVVAAVAVFLLLKNQLGFHRYVSQHAAATTLVGKQFPKNLHWESSRSTVVLALAVGCHYCTESATFYKALTERAHEHQTSIVAVLPQSRDLSATYLKNLGLKVDSVEQVDLAELGVHGTPTVFLVNSFGTIDNV